MYEHENKRDIHARSSAARLASTRRAAPRRAADCGNEPSRCLNFCHALRVYYKREVAPLRETYQNSFFLSPPVPEHCAAATIFLMPACGVHRTSGQ